MGWTKRALVVTAALGGCTGPFDSPGGAGVVEATVLDLPSALSERVLARPVEEGAPVEAGALLMRLDCRRLEAQRDQLKAEMKAMEADIAGLSARATAAETRTSAGRLRLDAKRSQTSALGADLEVAERDAERLRKVGRYTTEADRDRSDSRARSLRRKLTAAETETNAVRRDVKATRGEASALALQRTAAEHRLEAIGARLRRLLFDIEECRVVAPRAGVVEELFYEVGERTAAGRPLVRLIDLDEVWVTFYLANEDLGALTKGGAAHVRADAWPGEVFEGRVKTVAAEAEFTPRNIQTRDDRTRLVYPVEVHLDNPKHRLRPGMPVEVELGGAK